MVKRGFSMPLRALQGFIDSIFRLASCSIKLSASMCMMPSLKREHMITAKCARQIERNFV
ncbi:hypothetical protein [Vibrio splendidus]|uniref:hypothetical protein n=1 Tax=Vibrio splendidus TaxID=29497 RepID=UPI003BF8BDEA